jgi:hypothetical protein
MRSRIRLVLCLIHNTALQARLATPELALRASLRFSKAHTEMPESIASLVEKSRLTAATP